MITKEFFYNNDLHGPKLEINDELTIRTPDKRFDPHSLEYNNFSICGPCDKGDLPLSIFYVAPDQIFHHGYYYEFNDHGEHILGTIKSLTLKSHQDTNVIEVELFNENLIFCLSIEDNITKLRELDEVSINFWPTFGDRTSQPIILLNKKSLKIIQIDPAFLCPASRI